MTRTYPFENKNQKEVSFEVSIELLQNQTKPSQKRLNFETLYGFKHRHREYIYIFFFFERSKFISDTIGNIFTSGCATRENITNGFTR